MSTSTQSGGTKLCRHCKLEMPKDAKVCGHCTRKQFMNNRGLKIVVVLQALTIVGLSLMVFQERKNVSRSGAASSSMQDPDVERLQTVLIDLHSALAVGVNYAQLLEKVQVLAGALERLNHKNKYGDRLRPYNDSLLLYKDSLDLWTDEIRNSELYESIEIDYIPSVLNRIARDRKIDVSAKFLSNHFRAEALRQKLWQLADVRIRGGSLLD